MENTKKVVNTDKNLTIATPTTRTIVSIKNGSITESETTQEIDPNLTYIEKLQLKYKCCLLDWIIVCFCKKGMVWTDDCDSGVLDINDGDEDADCDDNNNDNL
ncbi:Hypothetical predicted protein [Octopus vulgaris]|uniref:Uncharacterized protein n=1 Tax=Octopus vulgaris TaxID=6645 RepID=A0AA36BKP6_OCTVU|nr:Hypothetical predicted protein [Octopus vulgaris]